MKTLKDLTPEIEAKIPQYIEAGLKNVFDGGYYNLFDYDKAVACVKWNYEKCGFAEPKVLVAENPKEILYMYADLLRKNGCTNVEEEIKKVPVSDMYLFTMNVYSNYYYQWYKFIKDEFKLPLSIEDEFEECFKLQRESGIYCALFLKDYCIVSKYPKLVHRNENNDLHSTTENAVIWGYSSEETKWDCHYVNGRYIEADIFNSVIQGTFTFDDFKKLDNEDLKGIIVNIIKDNKGNNGLMEFLNAEQVDQKTLVHEGGYTETITLYKTKDKYSFLLNSKGEDNQPYAWLHMVCPSTGTDYLIDTCPTYTDAVQCAKFMRPKLVPDTVDYKWVSAN